MSLIDSGFRSSTTFKWIVSQLTCLKSVLKVFWYDVWLIYSSLKQCTPTGMSSTSQGWLSAHLVVGVMVSNNVPWQNAGSLKKQTTGCVHEGISRSW